MKQTQQLNCSIPCSDYNLFKGVAFLQGKKINEAMTEAIALWLTEQSNKQKTKKNEQ